MLESHDLLYGAVIDRTGRPIANAGEIDRLEDAWLVASLLGGRGEAMRTYRGLEWMPPPQIIVADQSVAIVDKPSPTLVVVVFRASRSFDDDDATGVVESISDSIRAEFVSLS